MLHYLIYVSVRKAICTDEEIEEILEKSMHNNGRQNITGVLLYSDIHFVQYLEGSSEAINDCYNRIQKDSRHKFPRIIERGAIEKRTFKNWNMAGRRFTPNDFQFKTNPSDDDAEVLKNILLGKRREINHLVDIIKSFFIYG